MREVVLHYERAFDAPLPAAYEWLTDYQDDDPQRAGAIIKKRPVIERHKDRVVLEGELEVMGSRFRGRAVVHLFPPDRWEARFQRRDGSAGSVYEYRLVPEGPQRCRIVIAYRFRPHRRSTWLRMALAKPLIRRELDRMWDGFDASMRRELATPSASS